MGSIDCIVRNMSSKLKKIGEMIDNVNTEEICGTVISLERKLDRYTGPVTLYSIQKESDIIHVARKEFPQDIKCGDKLKIRFERIEYGQTGCLYGVLSRTFDHEGKPVYWNTITKYQKIKEYIIAKTTNALGE